MVQLRFDNISRIYLHPHLQRGAGGVSKDVPDYFTLHVLLERDLQGTPLHLLPSHKALSIYSLRPLLYSTTSTTSTGDTGGAAGCAGTEQGWR
jgi:hypothetical protein